MSETVALYTVTSGERFERARERLSEALGGASLGDPDSAGVLSVDVEADSSEAAEQRVRTALADSGTGDDFVLRQTTEGQEIPASDPRQPGAGGEPDVSVPAGEPTGAAAETPPAEPSGQPRYEPPAQSGGAGGTLKRFAPALGAGVLAALVLRRLRR